MTDASPDEQNKAALKIIHSILKLGSQGLYITSMNWKGKTVLISGATRGIGKAIGLRLAAEGANIGVIGKTDQPHPVLDGTVHSAVEEMKAAGGDGLALVCDVRSEEMVQAAVDALVEKFGGIDVVINNASAISLSGTEETTMKRYDLMQSVNTRGTFLLSKTAMPHLKKSAHAHILTLSPPLDIKQKWFAGHVAYTISKFGMSMVTLGIAAEYEDDDNIHANTLWPLTTIATAAVNNLLGGDTMMQMSRTPAIMADAAYAVLSSKRSGMHLIDEDVLREGGVTDFSGYRVNPEKDLMIDLFVEPARLRDTH